jgi:subtilisin family serine protease
MWRNPGESGDGKETNGLDDDGDGYIDDVFGINATDKEGNLPGPKAGAPMDDNGHGTHVAGTAGAVGNNGLGGSGVAWSAKIMACKFLNSSGAGAVSDAIECINYARLHGAKVMNNSWGGGAFSQALLDAIRMAGDAGAIFVAAAGNSSSNIATAPSYPAAYQAENVIAVAGTARDDGMYSYSNYGFGIVDIAAPGLDIYSTYGSADNAYGWMSGTSMATPIPIGHSPAGDQSDPPLGRTCGGAEGQDNPRRPDQSGRRSRLHQLGSVQRRVRRRLCDPGRPRLDPDIEPLRVDRARRTFPCRSHPLKDLVVEMGGPIDRRISA